MVDIATMTLKAVAREEAIGDAECRDQELQELQEQAKTMKIKMSEITKLMPQLLEAAELALRHPLGSTSSEQLNLMSQEWATKVGGWVRGGEEGGGGVEGRMGKVGEGLRGRWMRVERKVGE